MKPDCLELRLKLKMQDHSILTDQEQNTKYRLMGRIITALSSCIKNSLKSLNHSLGIFSLICHFYITSPWSYQLISKVTSPNKAFFERIP